MEEKIKGVYRRRETSRLSTSCYRVEAEGPANFIVRAYNFRDKKWMNTVRVMERKHFLSNYRPETLLENRERLIAKWGTD